MKKVFRFLILLCWIMTVLNSNFVRVTSAEAPSDGSRNAVEGGAAAMEEASAGKTKYGDIEICAFGDSIMYGAGNNGVGPMDMLADTYGFRLYKWATSGATVAWQEWPMEMEDESYRYFNIQYQISASIEAGDSPDIIVMNGRTNDLNWYEKQDGSWSIDEEVGELTAADDLGGNYDRTTFVGALETIFYTYRTAWPDAKVLYVIDFDMASTDKDETLEFTNALIDTAAKWNIETVDLYHEKFNTREDQYVCYTNPTKSKPAGDTTHPTAEGYRLFYLPLLEEKLVALMDTMIVA